MKRNPRYNRGVKFNEADKFRRLCKYEKVHEQFFDEVPTLEFFKLITYYVGECPTCGQRSPNEKLRPAKYRGICTRNKYDTHVLEPCARCWKTEWRYARYTLQPDRLYHADKDHPLWSGEWHPYSGTSFVRVYRTCYCCEREHFDLVRARVGTTLTSFRQLKPQKLL